MHPALLVGLSMLVPLACLALLMMLSWLEDTLDDESQSPAPSRVPAPIRSFPVPQAAEVAPERTPEAPAPEPAPEPIPEPRPAPTASPASAPAGP